MNPPSAAAFNTLVIANPFWDLTAYVPEQFLEENALQKGGTKVAKEESDADGSQLLALWEKARQYQTSETEIKGRSGGSGSNLMIPLTKLGNNKCTILGRIGNDLFGDNIEKHLSGIDVKSLLIKSETHRTGTVLCFITPDHERTMVAGLGATLDLNPDDIIKEKLQGYNHWHIEGYTFLYGIVHKCLQIAAESNATITLNLPTRDFVQDLKAAIQKSIPYLSIIVGNIEELQALTGAGDIHKAFEFFPIHQIVAATDGANGCWVKDKGKKEAVHYTTPKVEKVLNKTGAGDVWAGIFIAVALKGKSIATCVELANHGAGDWIQQKPGTYTAERTWEIFKTTLLQKN